MQKVKSQILRSKHQVRNSGSLTHAATAPVMRLYIPGTKVMAIENWSNARAVVLEDGLRFIPQRDRESLHKLQQRSARRKGASEVTGTDAEVLRAKKNAGLVALLRSFSEGDAEQQKSDLAALQTGLEEARPGQRKLFSEGFNP